MRKRYQSVDPNELFSERFHRAREKAEEAFWDAVIKEFPEVKTGDFPPGATMVWENCLKATLKEWLRLNYPDEYKDQYPDTWEQDDEGNWEIDYDNLE